MGAIGGLTPSGIPFQLCDFPIAHQKLVRASSLSSPIMATLFSV